MESLRAQGKADQAAVIEERFRKAWKRADLALTASRFMGWPDKRMAGTEAAMTGN
jgi:hypothetical protein